MAAARIYRHRRLLGVEQYESRRPTTQSLRLPLLKIDAHACEVSTCLRCRGQCSYGGDGSSCWCFCSWGTLRTLCKGRAVCSVRVGSGDGAWRRGFCPLVLRVSYLSGWRERVALRWRTLSSLAARLGQVRWAYGSVKKRHFARSRVLSVEIMSSAVLAGSIFLSRYGVVSLPLASRHFMYRAAKLF